MTLMDAWGFRSRAGPVAAAGGDSGVRQDIFRKAMTSPAPGIANACASARSFCGQDLKGS